MPNEGNTPPVFLLAHLSPGNLPHTTPAATHLPHRWRHSSPPENGELSGTSAGPKWAAAHIFVIMHKTNNIGWEGEGRPDGLRPMPGGKTRGAGAPEWGWGTGGKHRAQDLPGLPLRMYARPHPDPFPSPLMG